MQDTQSSRSRAQQLSLASQRRADSADAREAPDSARRHETPPRARGKLSGWSLLLWLCACNTGQIGEPTPLDRGLFNDMVGKTPTAGTSSTMATGSASKPGSSQNTNNGGSGGTSASAAQTCSTGSPLAAATPIARLTNTEYRNTLRSLFPKLSLPDVSLPADVVVEGFDNNAKAQTPSAALIEQYATAAEAVSDVVLANIADALPCSDQSEACATRFIDAFVTRAYRRPLQADERTKYIGLFKQANSDYGFQPAIAMVVQAALQSPHFLYRVELGDSTQALVPLDGYALASRLSYFFWDDMPDDALLDAAASGSLDKPAGMEAQARRMLADPKARPAVASLFQQWLRFDKMDRMPKSVDLFPQWSDDVAASLRRGTERFVEHVFWDMNGSLDALLTDTSSFVDQNTASLYGLSDPGSRFSDLTLADTSAQQRSGILTQVGLLAAFAHETADSPVLRGVFVMDRLLCSAPPPPPPGVTGSIEDNPQTSGMKLTTRDRVALTHESGECASCHHTIDGFGFGFSHYDAIGRWRELDNGLPVNATGWIEGTRDVDGPFNGAVELGQKLAKSTQVSECASAQWYRYSLGLGAKDVDSCALAPIAKAFADSDGSLQELMVAIATSDAFRNRAEVK